MIRIYDDTNENTVPSDLRYSRFLILFNIAICFSIVIMGLFSGDKIFEESIVIGLSGYSISGLILVGLYFLMYRVQRYPTIYAALSTLFLGIPTYISGLDEKIGITLSIIAVGYIVVYIALIKLYNIDDPDVQD